MPRFALTNEVRSNVIVVPEVNGTNLEPIFVPVDVNVD